MNISRIFFAGSLYIAVCTICAFAQHLNIRNYGPEEGLPQQQVFSIFQDSRGFMWFGTNSGASRYDGVVFENFDSSNGLNDTRVTSITEDAQGCLYLSTYDGLYVYDGKEFERYEVVNDLPREVIHCTIVEDDETSWLATAGGLTLRRGGSVQHFGSEDGLEAGYCNTVYRTKSGELYAGGNTGLFLMVGNRFIKQQIPEGANEHINVIIEDLNGSVWIGTNNGILRTRGKTIEVVDPGFGISSLLVLSAALQPNGTLWFGTTEGVLRYSKGKFNKFSTDNGLYHNTVFDIFVDNENNIWFGTFRGISKLRSGSFIYFDEETGLIRNGVSCVFEDSKNRIWVGSWEGGITIFEDNKIWTLGEQDGLTSPHVLSIAEGRDGRIFIGSVRGIYSWNDNNIETLTDSFGAGELYYDSQGRLWMALRSGVAIWSNGEAQKPDEQYMLPTSYVNCIIEDTNKNIWFATQREGCVVFDGKQSKKYDKNNGFTDKLIYSLDCDKEGGVWLGTLGDGAFYYDGKSFTSITTEEGLSNNFVWQVSVDSNNNVWFGTNSGVDLYDGTEFYHFDVDDGLAANEGNENACLEDSRGRLWFGSVNGLSQYVGNNLNHFTFRPPVYIDRFQINKESLDVAGTAVLEADRNNINFHFAGLGYRVDKRVRYRYILEGFERTWSESTSERSAQYTNVPPGKYTFKVAASVNKGYWSETPATVSFTILSPFYQTPWFIAVAILCSAAVFFATLQLLVRKIKKDKQRLEQVVKERTSEISAANEELKAFSHSVSHDLRAPLRHINGFIQILVDSHLEELSDNVKDYMHKISESANRMRALLDDLLKLSRVTHGEFSRKRVNLSSIAQGISENLEQEKPQREVEFVIKTDVFANGDENLLILVLENLIGNAWKFTRNKTEASIEFGMMQHKGKRVYFVRDDGAGFDQAQVARLFIPFQRLHSGADFEGTGIGLATVRRIIHRHNGQIWAEGEVGKGATFFFTLN